jgi:hypothetical protein
MTKYNIPLAESVEIGGKKRDYAIGGNIITQILNLRDKADKMVNVVHVDTNFAPILAKIKH